MSLSTVTSTRFFSTTSDLLGRMRSNSPRVHFGRVVLYNKRHMPMHHKLLFRKFEEKAMGFDDIPIHKYGCRGTGVKHPGGYWEHVPEMVPDLVVPNLEGFKLKPYVSYKSKDIYQEELTSKDLFHVIYGKKILKDFKEGKLDAEGSPIEPSAEEKLTEVEAYVMARRTGSDIALGGVPRTKMWDVRWDEK
jgi:large subunit ribosomal protein L41